MGSKGEVTAERRWRYWSLVYVLATRAKHRHRHLTPLIIQRIE